MLDHGCLLLRQVLRHAGVFPFPEASCSARFSPLCPVSSADPAGLWLCGPRMSLGYSPAALPTLSSSPQAPPAPACCSPTAFLAPRPSLSPHPRHRAQTEPQGAERTPACPLEHLHLDSCSASIPNSEVSSRASAPQRGRRLPLPLPTWVLIPPGLRAGIWESAHMGGKGTPSVSEGYNFWMRS